MAAVAENIKVPELRFPEFSNRWEELSLAAISSKITSGARDWARFYAEEGELFLRMTNLPREGVQLLLSDMKYVKLPAQNQEASRTSVASGDILMSITAELGKIGFVTQNESGGYINQHTALIRPKHVHSPKFLAQHLSSWQSRIRINRLNDSGAKASLNLKTVGKVLLSTPEFEEQQKIADFLTAVDERIAKLKRKKELLEEYKRGMMQKLFSQEIRFKDEDGNDFPDWEEKRLGEMMAISPRHRPLKIVPSQILTVQLHRKGVKRNTRTDTLSIGATTYYTRRAGEFVFGKQNLHRGAFDFIPKEFDGFLTSGDIPCLTIDDLILSPGYILNFLGRESFYSKLETIATGTGSKRIHERTFLNLCLTIPSLAEQQKIAKFLTRIDDKITVLSNQIADATEFKRGLLQKMFV